jgi:hypothetical protein
MASITRITIAAIVFGLFLTASIATQASPEPAAPTKARTWVAPAPQLFPLRKVDPRCINKPPVNVTNHWRLACDPGARLEPPPSGRHAFDTNA